ncbi:MAG: flagellar hook assembly protein FlgD [Pelovirga sp.]
MTAISGITSGSPAMSTLGSSDVSMGKEDFLKLLVAQLQHQDPLNPADPTEFTSQLAQFGQLEQLTNANKSLEQLAHMNGAVEKLSALSLIGQSVVAHASGFSYQGEPLQLGYQLDSPATQVTLYVQNQSGATLATIAGQQTAPGQHFVDWNGLDDTGTALPPGDYSLAIRAVDADEKMLGTAGLIKGRVEAIDLSGSAIRLETSSGSFAMHNIMHAGGLL